MKKLIRKSKRLIKRIRVFIVKLRFLVGQWESIKITESRHPGGKCCYKARFDRPLKPNGKVCDSAPHDVSVILSAALAEIQATSEACGKQLEEAARRVMERRRAVVVEP